MVIDLKLYRKMNDYFQYLSSFNQILIKKSFNKKIKGELNEVEK